MQAVYPPRCHPGGEDLSARLMSIIRISRSIAGYGHCYPYIANVPHRGSLTRPEQLSSPVYRAYRDRQQERLRRFPAINKSRRPANPLIPVVLSTERESAIPIPLHGLIWGSNIPASSPSQNPRHDECTQVDSVTESSSTTASQEKRPEDENMADGNNGIPADNRRTWSSRIMRLFAHPNSRYMKLLRRNRKNNREVRVNVDLRNDGSQQKLNAEEEEGNGTTEDQPSQSTIHRRRNLISRLARRVRKEIRKIFH